MSLRRRGVPVPASARAAGGKSDPASRVTVTVGRNGGATPPRLRLLLSRAPLLLPSVELNSVLCPGKLEPGRGPARLHHSIRLVTYPGPGTVTVTVGL